MLGIMGCRNRSRSRNRIFIIFQKFMIPIPIPIPAKIDFLTVLEWIPGTRSMFYKGWLIRDAFLELVNFSRILRDGHKSP